MPAQSEVTSFRVIPRSSAAKKTTHPRSQNNLPCLHRSQHSCLQFQPPLKPLLLRFLFRVFRVFRGEPWFPIENTVIEQAHAQLARAKAHATVLGPQRHECPRKTRSRHSALFRVLQRPKNTHTHAKQPALPPPFTTFLSPLPASPETATPTISFPCLPCLPW